MSDRHEENLRAYFDARSTMDVKNEVEAIRDLIRSEIERHERALHPENFKGDNYPLRFLDGNGIPVPNSTRTWPNRESVRSTLQALGLSLAADDVSAILEMFEPWRPK